MVVKLLDSKNRTLIYKFHNYINFHKFISHFKLPFITQQNPSKLNYLDFFLLRTTYCVFWLRYFVNFHLAFCVFVCYVALCGVAIRA